MRVDSPPYSAGLAAAYVAGGELWFSRRMSRWILKTICRGEVGRMLDMACGGGEAVRVFRAAGWQALGLDRSEAMLQIARTRNERGATFLQARMQESAKLGSRFNLVTCMYDAINCNLRVEDLFATFRNGYRLLLPGGRFVFDAFTVGGLHRAYDGLELHTRTRDHIVLTASWVDQRQHIGTKELLGASRVPEWTPWREEHHVRAYPPKVLVDGLKRAGFTSVTLYGWPSGRIISISETDDLDRIIVVAQR